MKFKTKIKLLKQKRYFDLGYGYTSYIKLPITIFGIGDAIEGKILSVVIMVLFYGIFCYVFGWAFIKYGWFTADLEITNKFNLFVKEMRKKIK